MNKDVVPAKTNQKMGLRKSNWEMKHTHMHTYIQTTLAKQPQHHLDLCM